MMLVSTLAFAILAAMIKTLSHFHVTQIVFFRALFTAILASFFIHRAGISFIGNNQKLLWLRTISGILAMTMFFMTIQIMPLGAAVSLKYLSPVFTAILAVVWLKEKVRGFQWLLFLTALFGVFLLKGFDIRIDMWGLILGISGAILGGVVYVTIRKIGNTDHPLVIVNYYMLTATVVMGFAMIPFWKNPSLYEWFLLVSSGIIGYYGQLTMTKAFQMESASRIAPIKYAELIYSLIIGWLLFGEGYSFLAFLGILLIMGSMIVNLKFKEK